MTQSAIDVHRERRVPNDCHPLREKSPTFLSHGRRDVKAARDAKIVRDIYYLWGLFRWLIALSATTSACLEAQEEGGGSKQAAPDAVEIRPEINHGILYWRAQCSATGIRSALSPIARPIAHYNVPNNARPKRHLHLAFTGRKRHSARYSSGGAIFPPLRVPMINRPGCRVLFAFFLLTAVRMFYKYYDMYDIVLPLTVPLAV